MRAFHSHPLPDRAFINAGMQAFAGAGASGRIAQSGAVGEDQVEASVSAGCGFGANPVAQNRLRLDGNLDIENAIVKNPTASGWGFNGKG